MHINVSLVHACLAKDLKNGIIVIVIVIIIIISSSSSIMIIADALGVPNVPFVAVAAATNPQTKDLEFRCDRVSQALKFLRAFPRHGGYSQNSTLWILSRADSQRACVRV